MSYFGASRLIDEVVKGSEGVAFPIEVKSPRVGGVFVVGVVFHVFLHVFRTPPTYFIIIETGMGSY